MYCYDQNNYIEANKEFAVCNITLSYYVIYFLEYVEKHFQMNYRYTGLFYVSGMDNVTVEKQVLQMIVLIIHYLFFQFTNINE